MHALIQLGIVRTWTLWATTCISEGLHILWLLCMWRPRCTTSKPVKYNQLYQLLWSLDQVVVLKQCKHIALGEVACSSNKNHFLSSIFLTLEFDLPYPLQHLSWADRVDGHVGLAYAMGLQTPGWHKEPPFYLTNLNKSYTGKKPNK